MYCMEVAIGMATQSTYRLSPARREVAERPTADRLGWGVSALFILGVSLVCWGLLVLAFGALIG